MFRDESKTYAGSGGSQGSVADSSQVSKGGLKFSILSLCHVCQSIINSKPDESLTWGVDDTTKAAGHRLYDVKTDHIAVMSQTKEKRTLTTGFIPNVSHRSEDSTASL